MNEKKTEEIIDYFYSFQNHFLDLGLANLKTFLETLGNPQDKTKVIHIAGTNGKGSVSAYLSNILICAGYRVGRYNSPAVFEPMESISINNQQIQGAEFARQVEKMRKQLDSVAEKGILPTVFELETALAYQYFADKNCDFAVVECGMGGQTDATNVTNRTILSILTSISMDHKKYLGDTLEKIASCKAGIIKDNVPVVFMEQDPEVIHAVRTEAEKKHSRCIPVFPSAVSTKESGLWGQRFSYHQQDGIEKVWELSMIGSYQQENAAEAIEAAAALKNQGYEISEAAVRQGLAKTKLPGRFDVIRTKTCPVILDGAHNPGAAERLRENILLNLPQYHLIFVLGVFADKDYQKIIDITAGLADMIYTVPAEGARALAPETLALTIRKSGYPAQAAEHVETALQMAKQEAKQWREKDKQAAIVCFGSLSYLKYVRKWLNSELEQE
jgi:dihydrofolate synthase/folylpolyglutamate synthase